MFSWRWGHNWEGLERCAISFPLSFCHPIAGSSEEICAVHRWTTVTTPTDVLTTLTIPWLFPNVIENLMGVKMLWLGRKRAAITGHIKALLKNEKRENYILWKFLIWWTKIYFLLISTNLLWIEMISCVIISTLCPFLHSFSLSHTHTHSIIMENGNWKISWLELAVIWTNGDRNRIVRGE